MVHSRYLPNSFDDMVSHIVEECGEVLAAAGKLQRFGAASTNPLLVNDNTTNIEWLYRELLDLKLTSGRLILKIEEIYMYEE